MTRVWSALDKEDLRTIVMRVNLAKESKWVFLGTHPKKRQRLHISRNFKDKNKTKSAVFCDEDKIVRHVTVATLEQAAGVRQPKPEEFWSEMSKRIEGMRELELMALSDKSAHKIAHKIDDLEKAKDDLERAINGRLEYLYDVNVLENIEAEYITYPSNVCKACQQAYLAHIANLSR